MNKLLEAVKELIRQKAVHRKGFPIQKATVQLAAGNAVEELGELLVAVALNDRNKVLEEFADVMAILVHLSILLGVSLEQLEEQAIEKMKLRFKLPDAEGLELL